MKGIKYLKWITWGVCLAVFMAFGVRNLKEPDIWWILRTGEWIVQNMKVPDRDIFSYTFTGSAWINVKWLYEVLVYFIQKFSGPEMILILQVVINLLFYLFIFKIYNLLKSEAGIIGKIPGSGFIIAALITVFATEFRMTGRPENISYLFALIYFYIFTRYRLKPGKFILWLIPLQMLWTNLHEAYGTGMVMILLYLCCELFDRLFIQNGNLKTIKNTKWLYLSSALAILSVCLNPRGPSMLLHPLQIFSQLNVNKFTTELLSMFAAWDVYKKEVILSLAVFVTLMFSFLKKKEAFNKKFIFRPLYKYGSFTFALFLMFFYLSFTAIRNIPFFMLCFSPFLAIFLDQLSRIQLKKKPFEAATSKVLFPSVLLFFSLVIYISIVSDYFYLHFDKKERYGLQLAENQNPVGVADFISSNGIRGRCFSDYLVSSYLLWKLRPDFKTFIDLRDLDVFPPSFFNYFGNLMFIPKEFEKADQKYHFDYIVLYRHVFYHFHKYLVSGTRWKLVYADAVTLCFIKNPAKDSAGLTTQKDVYQIPAEPLSSGSAVVISKLFNPFYRVSKRKDMDYNLIAADIYNNIGKTELALKYIRKSLEHPVDRAASYAKSGDIFLSVAENNGLSSYYDSAYAAFNTAVKYNSRNPEANRGAGFFEYRSSRFKLAEKHLVAAEKFYKNDPEIYRMLAGCQFVFSEQYPGKKDLYIKKWEKYLLKAFIINPNDPFIRYDLGVYYSDQNQCDKAKGYLNGLDTNIMNAREKQKLKFSRQNCGIE